MRRDEYWYYCRGCAYMSSSGPASTEYLEAKVVAGEGGLQRRERCAHNHHLSIEPTIQLTKSLEAD